jgi:AcrR family transcriptional regulator
MSISYELTGRRDQKARTRQALIAAARELLAHGATPTVEAAAVAASISRATAYRYFPNQRSLLVAAHPEVDMRSLLGADAPLEPEARLDAVVNGTVDIFLRSEAAYRTMLRLSLESDPAMRGDLILRKGARLTWIADALEPVRDVLETGDFRRLVHAIAAVIGIEAMTVLVDLAGLSRTEAVDVIRWSARALLRSALAAAPDPADAGGAVADE